ncbi:MAG: hypothetical protein R3B84_08470 [Zavarzinella sp.]
MHKLLGFRKLKRAKISLSNNVSGCISCEMGKNTNKKNFNSNMGGTMPNDAKLGLLVGVVLVVLIAVLFFQKEPGNTGKSSEATTSLQATTKQPPAMNVDSGLNRITRPNNVAGVPVSRVIEK